MKTLAILALALALMLAGCGGNSALSGSPANTQASAQTTAYQTLKTAADTYDATMKTVASLYKQGIINDQVKAQALTFTTAFRTAYGKAIDVMEAGGTPSITSVSAALADLLNFLKPYLEQGAKA